MPLFTQHSSPVIMPDAPQYERDLTQNRNSNLITFSEFPTGSISNEYQAKGILFSGSGPKIINDGSNPTTPVLSGTPTLFGDITGTFTVPGTTDQGVVNSFVLDAGYFNAIGETSLTWYDVNGNVIGSITNSHFGIETFEINGTNIARWHISATVNEGGGYAIDNVSFDDPIKLDGVVAMTSIPTVGEWGCISLFLSLLIVSVLKISQSKGVILSRQIESLH